MSEFKITAFADYYQIKEEHARLTAENADLAKQKDQLCEELSGCVSDQLDPLVNVGWMRCSPKLPEYVQGLERENAELRAKLEQAEAKCAVKDVALGEIMSLHKPDAQDDYSTGIARAYKRCQDIASAALSTDCGTGWASPEKQDEEIGRWQNEIYQLLCKFCPDINIDGAGSDSGDPLDFTVSEIGQALAHLQNKIDDGKGILEKVQRLEEALEGLLPFAISYRSHQLRNPNDKLDERLEAAKQALAATSTETGGEK